MIFLTGVLLAAQFLTNLNPKSVAAFDEYLKTVDAAVAARAVGPEPLAQTPARVYSSHAGKEIPNALIHDWTAVTFVPKATRANAVALLEDFSRHSSVYPEVVEGRVESRRPNQVMGFHRLRKKKVLEVTMEARYQLDVLRAREGRYASRSKAIELVELDDAGTSKERRRPPGQDHGFLWRLQTYWILEETPQGLWMEVRSVSLTRDVPTGLGWVIKPLVKEVPREALEGLLAATRKALLASEGNSLR